MWNQLEHGDKRGAGGSGHHHGVHPGAGAGQVTGLIGQWSLGSLCGQALFICVAQL